MSEHCPSLTALWRELRRGRSMETSADHMTKFAEYLDLRSATREQAVFRRAPGRQDSTTYTSRPSPDTRRKCCRFCFICLRRLEAQIGTSITCPRTRALRHRPGPNPSGVPAVRLPYVPHAVRFFHDSQSFMRRADHRRHVKRAAAQNQVENRPELINTGRTGAQAAAGPRFPIFLLEHSRHD